MFLWNWKCKKIFPKPCKNISRKVIRNPFKKIFCIIAWNVSAKLLQRFGHGVDIVKTHYKKCYVWRGSLSSRPLWVTHPERFILREISSQKAGNIIKLLVFITYSNAARERSPTRVWLFVHGADESSWSWLPRRWMAEDSVVVIFRSRVVVSSRRPI